MQSEEYILYVNQVAERIGRPDQSAMEQARTRLDNLTKPVGSLGELEHLLVKAAGIQRLAFPRFDRPQIVIMAGDHGITEEGVSAYPSEVTAQMVGNFLQGGAAVNALARQAGADVHVVDIGVKVPVEHPLLIDCNVRRGTRNFAREEALTTAEVWEAIARGARLGEALANGGGRCLLLGEMGIGNTTASAAILAALTELPAASLVGSGTGIDDAKVAHKAATIEAALRRHRPDPRNPLDILRKCGGLEIAGLCGVALGAAAHRAVILVDGLISTVAALLAVQMEPRVGQYLIAGHESHEPGHAVALQRLGLTPLLRLSLRLGEASGAALALLLLQGAERTMREMATFAEASVTGADAIADAHGVSVGSAVAALVAAPVAATDADAAPVAAPVAATGDGGALQTPSPYQALPQTSAEPGERFAIGDLQFDEAERSAVYKAIYLRRDIRRFLSQPLSDEAVLRILNAGHHGPSVGFMQPWNFILIREEGGKRALRDVVEAERVAASHHFQGKRKDDYTALKVEGILEAPLTICVTSDPTRGGTHVLGRNSIPETDLFSVSCAIENMWLAARAENIALGWVSIYQKADIQEILGIPPHVVPVGLLSLGYTEEWPRQPLLQTSGWRERIPFAEVVFHEQWGSKR